MIVYGSTRLTDTASLAATASHGISPNILPALHRRGVLPARVSARTLGPEPLAQASRRQAGASDAIDRNGRPASPSGPTYVAIHLVTTVVGLTKRPDRTVVTLQSDVQFLDVWNTTRGPRMRPARS